MWWELVHGERCIPVEEGERKERGREERHEQWVKDSLLYINHWPHPQCTYSYNRWALSDSEMSVHDLCHMLGDPFRELHGWINIHTGQGFIQDFLGEEVCGALPQCHVWVWDYTSFLGEGKERGIEAGGFQDHPLCMKPWHTYHVSSRRRGFKPVTPFENGRGLQFSDVMFGTAKES